MEDARTESYYLHVNQNGSLYFNSGVLVDMMNQLDAKPDDIAAFLGVPDDTFNNWVRYERIPKRSAAKFDKLWCKLVNLCQANLKWKYFDCVQPDKQRDIPEDAITYVPAVFDNVNRPSHYTNGDIEFIDYCRDKLSSEQFAGFCLGNVLKYVSRARFKNGIEDLKKAEVYLKWAIENEEKKGENRNA